MRNMTIRVSAFLLAFFMCIHMPVQVVSASYDAGPGSVESVSGNSAGEVSLPAPAEPDTAGSVSGNSVEEIETAGDIAKALPDENAAVGEGAADTGLQETSLSFGGDKETAGDPSANANWGGDMMGLTKAKTNAETYIADGAKIPEIRIAVIDTGINTAHEVFAGRLTGDVSAIGDDNGHGTAVAGIIAQNTPSNVKILPLKALDANKKGSIENVVEAVNTAVSEGAQIINVSLGISREEADEAEYTQYKALVGEAIRTAKEAGCIIVVSAGNEVGGGKDIASSGEFPACLDNVITVSAINENKERYEFSNFGDAVDFCAPGEDISCASIKESTPYQYLSGTSMAAPFISSALAYLKMYNSGLSADEVIRLLEGCADDLGTKGKDPYFGKGLPVFPDGKVAGDENAIETDEKYVKPVIMKAYSTGTSIELTVAVPKGEVYDVCRKEKGEEGAFHIVVEDKVSISDTNDTVLDDNGVEYGKIYEYRITVQRDRQSEKNDSDPYEKRASIDAKSIYIGPASGYHDKTIYINADETMQLTASYSPKDAETDGKFKWSSSDESIVTVDEQGMITGISGGKAKIILELPDARLATMRRVEVSSLSNVIGGKCGDDLTWQIGGGNGDTLIISGSGSMYYSKDYPWAQYQDQIKKLVIEDGVTALPDARSSIYDGVFSSLKQLESVDIGSGLTAISMCAFRDCIALREVFISDGLESIKDGAFSGCSSLQTIPFPDTLTTIGMSAFERCKALTKIEFPDSVTSIGRWAVSADSLEEFRIPEGVTKADQIFNGKIKNLVISKNLKEYIETEGAYTAVANYVVEEGNAYFSSDSGVLFNYDKTELIKYPKEREGGYDIPDSVKSVADSAFESCINLTDVRGGDSLIKVGKRAFYGCTKLTDIQLPDSVETIGEEAFSYCSQLTEFVYPASVEICNQCFDGTKLTKVTLPSNVKKMYSTFFGCKYLEDIYIPEGLEEISGDVFSDCVLLKKIELPSSLKYFGTMSRSNNDYGFMGGCTSVEEFAVPDCATELRSLTFRGCTSLKKITIPASVNYIDKWACIGGVPLEDVIYKSFTKSWNQIKNESQVIKDAALHIDVSGTFENGITWHAEGLSGDLTLTISGDGAMPDFASPSELPWYDGLPEITHVVIGDGITHVGANAFYNAGKLKDAVIGRDVTSFGNNAFRLCGNLDTFIFAAENGDSYQVEPQFLVSRYTEKNIEPGVHVTKGADVLREGTDYTVGYRDNIKAGTALIVITFTGDHAARGTALIPFTIASELLEGENIKALSNMDLRGLPFVYTGNEQTPTVIVMSGQWTLREKIDYLLTLSPGRIDRGTYRVVAQGIGAYQGAQAKLYEITACDIADLGSKARVSPSSFIYDGSEKRPVLSIPGLLAGKDFTVTYSDNTEAGEAAVTASGTGNYKGTLTRSFTIEEAVKEPEGPDPKPDDTDPEMGETKPGTDSTDPGTDSTGSGPESSRPGSKREKPETGGAGSKTEGTKQGTGAGGSKKDTSSSQKGSSASRGACSGTVTAKTAPESAGTKEAAGTSNTAVSANTGTSNTDAAADSRSSADQNSAVSKDDSTASVKEGTADSAAGTSADSTAEPAGKDEAEARNTEEAPQGKSSAALTAGSEKNNLDRSLKGAALTLILLTAAVAAYYLILLIKRRKDKEEEEQGR